MLTLLYVYRGRAFIVYWIGGWLFTAAALGLAAGTYADATLDRVLTGLAVLFMVWASGLALLAAETFPQRALRWSTRRLNAIAGSAVWFLLAPFLVRSSIVVVSGALISAALLGWAGTMYLRLARESRYAGALLISAGLALIAVVTIVGALTTTSVNASLWQDRLGTVTILNTVLAALGMHLLVFEDMTQELRLANRQLAGANEEIRRLAIIDPLTGCHNRRFFDEVERRELERHRRYGTPLSIVFLDVNHFKRLNDTLGHDRGDAVLWMIGNTLRTQVRQSDCAVRWGGDEFLLLLSCEEAEAREKARSLKEAFDRQRAAAGLPDYLGLSIGVAPAGADSATLRDTIREADGRMYRDKMSEARP
jgi:diguanylate cyclase (GGDEF)-like protein